MANGSLRAVVYAKRACNGADPLGFHSPAFTHNVQANMSAGATAAGKAQQCLYVHPAAAAHLRRARERERKKIPRPTFCTPLLMQTMPRHKGLETKCSVHLEKGPALSCFPSRSLHQEIFGINHRRSIPQCLQAGSISESSLRLFFFNRVEKSILAQLSWDD